MALLRYAFEEAAGSLWRGRQSGALSTATIAIALFVLGAVLLVTANLQRAGEAWSGAAELSVYLAEQSTSAQRRAVSDVLRANPAVASVDFLSKEVALQRFTEMFPDLSPTLATLGDNPLPASYEARLRASADAPGVVDALVARLRTLEGVTDVGYDRQWLERLLRGIRVLRVVGLGLSAALMLAAALTVGNVVRLALAARRDELEIMQLIGAPRTYVRGPFVMEGALQGGLGAAVAVTALAAVFVASRRALLAPVADALHLPQVAFLSPLAVLALLGGGTVVGCAAGLLASRRA